MYYNIGPMSYSLFLYTHRRESWGIWRGATPRTYNDNILYISFRWSVSQAPHEKNVYTVIENEVSIDRLKTNCYSESPLILYYCKQIIIQKVQNYLIRTLAIQVRIGTNSLQIKWKLFYYYHLLLFLINDLMWQVLKTIKTI